LSAVDALAITPAALTSMIIAVSFAAGLNVYATVCSLGLMARLHWITLPGELGTLGDTWIIVASGLLFLGEFVADKIPGFDLVWNALHTFIRIPAAALMAYAAGASLTPVQKLLVTVAAAAVAAIAHSSKTAARVVVTPSPEPLSNIALSATEDVGAIGLTWLATHHPLATGATVAVITLALVGTLRFTVRRLREMFGGPSRRAGTAGLARPHR
jgi:hypothetical protein